MATLRKDGRYHKILQKNNIKVTGYGQTAEEADRDAETKLKTALTSISLPTMMVTNLRDVAAKYWLPEVKAKRPGTRKRYLAAFAHISKWLVVGQFESRPTISSIVQTWSEIPAATAGLVFSV